MAGERPDFPRYGTRRDHSRLLHQRRICQCGSKNRPRARMNAQQSFLGLEVRLAGVQRARVDVFVREAWAAQAPKALVKQYMAS